MSKLFKLFLDCLDYAVATCSILLLCCHP